MRWIERIWRFYERWPNSRETTMCHCEEQKRRSNPVSLTGLPRPAVLAGLAMTALLFAWLPVDAKFGPAVRERIEAVFTPAVAHGGLLTAQEPLDRTKLRGFVVLEKAGLPAEKAYNFITNQEYEYRPVVIEGNRMTTRRGPSYLFLSQGQLMVIAGVEYSGNTVYLKLLSPEPMAHATAHDVRPSRVALMLGFKFPKAVAETDAETIRKTIEVWCKPFASRADAEAYSLRMTAPNRLSPHSHRLSH